MSEKSFIDGDYSLWVYVVAFAGSIAFPPLGAFVAAWVVWELLRGDEGDRAADADA